VEEGRVGLDAPVADYLPASLLAGLHVWKGVDRTAEITVRHLLGHATGLAEYLSDTNYQLLIAIIEAVTGQPLHDAYDALIFRRLGLTRTFLPGSPAAATAPRPAAVWGVDQRLDELPGAMRSFRDLYSTADETLRFMAALVSGEAFDDPGTARLMTAHWNPLAFSLSLTPVAPGWPIEYGLGMMRFRLPRLLTPFRPVPELIGHTGVTGSWLFHCPELDLILAGTVDQVTAAPVPFRFLPRLIRTLQDVDFDVDVDEG
jgi:D-alanyl-D-alanine carboxypeptidase